MQTVTAVAPEPRKRFSLHGRMRLYALKKAVQASRRGQPRREAFWRGFFSGLNGPRSN